MNSAYLHLVLNHIPVFLLTGGLFLFFLTMFWKSTDVRKVSLVLMVFAGVMVIPAFLTGEGAEDMVEKIPGVQNSAIEPHEENAGLSLWSVIATGLLALAALIFMLKKRPVPYSVMIPLLAAALFACVTLLITARSGGEIRHTETSQTDSKVMDKKKHDDD